MPPANSNAIAPRERIELEGGLTDGGAAGILRRVGFLDLVNDDEQRSPALLLVLRPCRGGTRAASSCPDVSPPTARMSVPNKRSVRSRGAYFTSYDPVSRGRRPALSGDDFPTPVAP